MEHPRQQALAGDQRDPRRPRLLSRGTYFLSGAAGQIPERLFRRDDMFATENGWRIEVLRGGWARRCRDRRFGSLERCGDCSGAGRVGMLRCGRCAGSRRVSLAGLPERVR